MACVLGREQQELLAPPQLVEAHVHGGVVDVYRPEPGTALADDGTAHVGLDDFARKLLGRIDTIEFPEAGSTVKAGEPLFGIRQGERAARFNAPISGKVVKANERMGRNPARLEASAYGKNWICVIEGDDLDAELPGLKIGKSAVAFFQEDIDRFREFVQEAEGGEEGDPAVLYIGAFEKLEEARWAQAVEAFFTRLELSSLGAYVDASGRAGTLLEARGLPTTLLLDRDGREVGRTVGPAAWDSDEVIALIEQQVALGQPARQAVNDY